MVASVGSSVQVTFASLPETEVGDKLKSMSEHQIHQVALKLSSILLDGLNKYIDPLLTITCPIDSNGNVVEKSVRLKLFESAKIVFEDNLKENLFLGSLSPLATNTFPPYSCDEFLDKNQALQEAVTGLLPQDYGMTLKVSVKDSDLVFSVTEKMGAEKLLKTKFSLKSLQG